MLLTTVARLISKSTCFSQLPGKASLINRNKSVKICFAEHQFRQQIQQDHKIEKGVIFGPLCLFFSISHQILEKHDLGWIYPNTHFCRMEGWSQHVYKSSPKYFWWRLPSQIQRNPCGGFSFNQEGRGHNTYRVIWVRNARVQRLVKAQQDDEC